MFIAKMNFVLRNLIKQYMVYPSLYSSNESDHLVIVGSIW